LIINHFLVIDNQSKKLNIATLTLKIHLNERFFEDNIITVNMILDGLKCSIQRPLDNQIQKNYYSRKKKRHTIKYKIAIQLIFGKVVWLADSIPGSIHDLEVTKSCELLDQLLKNEMILTDKAYIGETYFIHSFKSASTIQKK
jgi:hypothetical protein